MTNDAGPGTTRGCWPAARANGTTPALPARGTDRAMSGSVSSSTPAMRCGRTPTTSPNINTPDWPGSPRPTPGCTAPICSKRACGRFFGQRHRRQTGPDRWICWARRCRIPGFVALARRIVKHRQAIDAALDHGLSQGLIESVNTKIRLLTRIAFGFAPPKPSSPWRCSPSAATAPACPAAPAKPHPPRRPAPPPGPPRPRNHAPPPAGVNVVRPRLRPRAPHDDTGEGADANRPRRGGPGRMTSHSSTTSERPQYPRFSQ